MKNKSSNPPVLKFTRILFGFALMISECFGTITTQTARVGPYTASSLPATLAVTFPYQQASDLTVLDLGQGGTTNDPPVTLTLNSDYTVTGGGYNSITNMQSGNVVVVSGGSGNVQANDQIVILRNVPQTQGTSFPATGTITGPMIEKALDKGITVSQQITEEASRALRFEPGETLDGTLNRTARAGKFLGFDATGAITYSGSTGGGGGTTYSAGAGLLLASNVFSVNPTQSLLALTVTNPVNASITGNSATATALLTPRAINGVNFDGTAAITVAAAAATLTGTALPSTITSAPGLLSTSIGTLGSMALQSSSAVSVTGGTINGATVTGLPVPSASTDAATKAYADGIAAGIVLRTAVVVATTANITLSGTQTIDGQAVIAGNRVLVKNQSTTSQNGIYDCAAGAWSRSSDSNTAAQLKVGYLYFVQSGTANGSSSWSITTAPTLLNTDPVVFSQFGASSSYSAGTGLALTGNVFSLNAAQSGLTLTGSAFNGTIGATTPSTIVGTTLTTSGKNYLDNLVVKSNQLNETGTNAVATVALNYDGYNGGTTQYRNVDVYDGKNNSVATFTGSTKSLNVVGGINSTTVGSTTPAAGAFTTLGATGQITASATGAFLATGNGGTAAEYVQFQNTGGTGYLGIDNSTGATLLSGHGYDMTLLHPTGVSTVIGSTPITRTTPAGLAVTGALSATGAITGSNLSGTNTGDQTNISGNAATATALQTGRTINGVTFDGTANITVAAAAGTLTGTTLAAGVTASSLTSVGTLAALTVTATITGSVSGSAGSAAVLTTPRTIGGSSFDGSANVTSFPSPGAIGATTPSTGAFTTLSASGNSQLGSGTGSKIVTIGDSTGANDAQLRLRPNTGEYSWSIGASTLVGNSLTITPSTAVAGATFTTPVISISTAGLSVTGGIQATGTINVRNYGAKGDGTTDDTTAINNAVAALASHNALYFPAGKYKITAGITALDSLTNIKIYGDGQSSEIYNSVTGTGANTIVVNATCSNVEISNLAFTGAATVRGNGIHIRMSASHNWIHDCYFQGCSDFAVLESAGNATQLTSFAVTNNQMFETLGDGVHVGSATDGVVNSNVILASGDDGIGIIADYSAYPPNRITVVGNTITYAGNASYVPTAVSGCGIRVDEATDILVSNNSIYSPHENGIMVERNNSTTAYSARVSIRGNKIYNGGAASPGTVGSIELKFCNQSDVTDNQVIDPHYQSGIAFKDCNDLVIHGNYIRNCPSRSITVDANSEDVSAGSFVTGAHYYIEVPGSTNFTLIGAANNNIGTAFTATGPGTGSGIATSVSPSWTQIFITNNDIDWTVANEAIWVVPYGSAITITNLMITGNTGQIVGGNWIYYDYCTTGRVFNNTNLSGATVGAGAHNTGVTTGQNN